MPNWSLGTKLVLLILGFTVAGMCLIFGAIFFFKIEVETKIEVSALLTSMAIILLVVERLRASLSDSVKYLHTTLLSEIQFQFGPTRNLYHKIDKGDKLRRLREDLETYGKFLGIISLYPQRLSERVEEFLSLHDQFHINFGKIRDMVKFDNPHPNWGWFGDALGFEPETYPNKETDQFKSYRENAQKIRKDHSELVAQTKNLYETLYGMSEEIQAMLFDFFRKNKLKLDMHAFRF